MRSFTGNSANVMAEQSDANRSEQKACCHYLLNSNLGVKYGGITMAPGVSEITHCTHKQALPSVAARPW